MEYNNKQQIFCSIGHMTVWYTDAQRETFMKHVPTLCEMIAKADSTLKIGDRKRTMFCKIKDAVYEFNGMFKHNYLHVAWILNGYHWRKYQTPEQRLRQCDKYPGYWRDYNF
jgi:hypothetical protein